MTNEMLWRAGRLQELSEGECRELLGSASVGRIAFVDDTGPTVLPVNFVMSGNGLIFRTSPRTELARYIDGRRVAFEGDDFDEFHQSGWSVLVRGVARFVEEPGELPADERPTPWAEGIRSLFVRIETDTVTGRRLLGGA